ncbi:MAG: outer membrane lipoprotein chaperone LolA [Gammaproteobacteria bacterium]|nr:outer membrane lipoprotein chaperone LolA [Gammaproteobacteria bacterium]MCH9744463.1 outer membrane lipoprotein chaperone LolA [Gammaproteobacteria bacterium]
MLKIIKISFVCLLCSLFLLPLAVEAQTVAQQLQAQLQRFRTYQADFQQQVYDNRQHIISRASGKMAMKRPGMFRWETYQPSHQIVLTNGVWLWNYNVDLMQATQQKLQKGSRLNAATLLTGNAAKLLQQFSVTQSQRNDSSQIYQLTPKQKNDNFSWIKLSFKNNALVQMQFLNNLDQVSSFDFHDIRLNQSLDDSLFNFKAPKGVDIVKQ